jgi:UDP-N-acetylmuramoylalanine--D-glutamate ligase
VRDRFRALLPVLHRFRPLTDLPRRALVLGLARSGQAAAAALARRGVQVVGADRKLGNDEDVSLVDDVGLLVKSPGVPGDVALVAAARRRGIPVWSEVELGFRLLRRNPFIAVTGTNGKTTTSELLGFMVAAPVAGNVGRALCELDGQVDPDAWIVCEISSFQLEDVHELRPRIAVLLNLEPDHLDRHASFEDYRAAKLRIFENQGEGDTAVVPRGFGAVPGTARRAEFAADDPLPAEPRIPGAHNRENAAAATAAARAAGATDEEIARGLRGFPGVLHRLELVTEIGGVRYVNDSKATNVASALRALAAYADAPVHLILGGYRKGEDLGLLAHAIGPNVRSVLVIGQTGPEFARLIPQAMQAGDLATAVGRAAEAARPGDVVLLSPACASYDQYENFERRGEDFRRLVQNLEG